MSLAVAVKRDTARGRSIPYDNAPVIFTPHAVEQANARHFRHLDLDRTRRELENLAAERGLLCATAPQWLSARGERVEIWLLIDELAFPIYDRSPDGALVAGTALSPMTTPVGASVRIVKVKAAT
jgi:hypothetical protein